METMTTSIILPFLVFFPFLGAVISYIIGRSNKGARLRRDSCRADGRNLADYNHLFQGIHGG